MQSTIHRNPALRIAAILALFAATLFAASCSSQQSDQHLQRQAQRATVRAKMAADKAAAEARSAAANARREARDIAKGVHAGLRTRGAAQAAGLVDVNSASLARLERLPGIDPASARRIQSRRPYRGPHALVTKGAITQREYDRIAGDIVAQH